MIEIKCKQCNKIFKVNPYRIKNNTVKYCGKKCFNLSKVGLLTWNKGLKGFGRTHFLGKHHTKESKLKISNSKIGKRRIPWTEIQKEELRKKRYKKDNPFYGKHHSKKTKNFLRLVNLGKKNSKETNEKIHLAKLGKKNSKISGNKNHFWNGGRTSLYNQIIGLLEYSQWRNDVFKRDKYICKICGYNKGNSLNSHHIKTRKQIIIENNIKIIEDAINCKELWNINNGITLCKKCHSLTFRKEKKYQKLFYDIIKKTQLSKLLVSLQN